MQNTAGIYGRSLLVSTDTKRHELVAEKLHRKEIKSKKKRNEKNWCNDDLKCNLGPTKTENDAKPAGPLLNSPMRYDSALQNRLNK